MEDNAGYFKAAKTLVSKLQRLDDSMNNKHNDNNDDNDDKNNDNHKTKNNNDDDDDDNNNINNNGIDDDEKEIYRKDIRTLMSPTMMNTNIHVVFTPMATYLVIYGSRFGYINEFQ